MAWHDSLLAYYLNCIKWEKEIHLPPLRFLKCNKSEIGKWWNVNARRNLIVKVCVREKSNQCRGIRAVKTQTQLALRKNSTFRKTSCFTKRPLMINNVNIVWPFRATSNLVMNSKAPSMATRSNRIYITDRDACPIVWELSEISFVFNAIASWEAKNTSKAGRTAFFFIRSLGAVNETVLVEIGKIRRRRPVYFHFYDRWKETCPNSISFIIPLNLWKPFCETSLMASYGKSLFAGFSRGFVSRKPLSRTSAFIGCLTVNKSLFWAEPESNKCSFDVDDYWWS